MNVLLSHGSPDDAHRLAVEALAAGVSIQLGEPVTAAFLDDALPDRARVLPLFLTQGRHLRNDVPAMIQAADACLLAGPADFPAEMAEMALESVVELRNKQRAVMFALYRLGGAQALMAELYDRSKKFSLPAIAGLYGQCDAASVLRLWKSEGHKDALVQPVLLFPGHSLDALRQAAQDSGLNIAIGPVLSEHPRFTAWLAERFKESV